MNLTYVDTSCLVAIAFGEPGWERVAQALDAADVLLASNLMEAELRAAFTRERVEVPCEPMLARVTWLHPNRPLSAEQRRALAHGYLRGADLWHVACALYVAPEPAAMTFATLDGRQGDVAARLGFGRLPP